MRNNLVICPVFNEEATIEVFFEDLRKFYYDDILFIDDGSTDRSNYLISKFKNNNTFFIKNHARLGYGAALMKGFRFAIDKKYRRVVTLDVDLQHRPEHIPFFLHQLLEHKVVLGSRYVSLNRSFNVPRQRLMINRYISRLLEVLFCIKFSDPFCGFRGYQSSFLRKVNLKEKSYGLALEILMEVIRFKVPFTEIPVEVIYSDEVRRFLDGLDDTRIRLLYYLEIISRKRKDIEHEEKISYCQPAS